MIEADAIGPIADRLRAVQLEVAAACARAHRAPTSVTLIAVSKGHGPDAIRAAYAAGQRHFGENYAAEFAGKLAALNDLDITWHFIGRVQRGNVKIIAQARLVHGVGSTSQAEALHKEALKRDLPLPVLLQVNLTGEDTKNGFTGGSSSSSLSAALPSLRALPGLALRGLMAMPNVDDVRAAFAAVRDLRDAVCPELRELSMGMSGDFGVAVEEGATLVRVGTAIFGARPPLPPSNQRDKG